MKKVNQFLNIIIGSFTGVFIGRSLYVYWDFKTHPILYALCSAPWYTGIMLEGAVVAVIVGITCIMKFFVKKKMEKQL